MSDAPTTTQPVDEDARPLKIGILIEHFDPSGGGAERSTAQIAEQLVARGHEVTVLTGCARASEQERKGIEQDEAGWVWQKKAGYRIRAMTYRKSSSVLRLLLFRKWAIAQRDVGDFDVTLSITNAVAADVMQPRGGTVRETLEQNIAMRSTATAWLFKRVLLMLDPKQQLLLHFERQSLADPRVNRIIAVSDYVERQLHEHYGVDADRIRVIDNAAAMPVFDEEKRAAARQEVRSALGIADKIPVYLFAAMNARLKGLGALLEAMAMLAEDDFDGVLLIAGVHRYAIVHQVAALKLREHIRYIGPTRDIPSLYAAADVTVLPTWYDPSSKVVIESLMLGVPVITTRFNGAAALVNSAGSETKIGTEPASRGRVIERPDDVGSLARAMSELADPAERHRCAAACMGLAEELSMRRHVERLEAVLRNATAEAEPDEGAAEPFATLDND